MRCQQCHASIKDGDLFCSRCGAKIQRVCSKCGGEIADGDLFCRKCGSPLSSCQSHSDEVLIDVAKSVAHRLNNALSIVLTNSQLSMKQVAQLTG